MNEKRRTLELNSRPNRSSGKPHNYNTCERPSHAPWDGAVTTTSLCVVLVRPLTSHSIGTFRAIVRQQGIGQSIIIWRPGGWAGIWCPRSSNIWHHTTEQQPLSSCLPTGLAAYNIVIAPVFYWLAWVIIESLNASHSEEKGNFDKASC